MPTRQAEGEGGKDDAAKALDSPDHPPTTDDEQDFPVMKKSKRQGESMNYTTSSKRRNASTLRQHRGLNNMVNSVSAHESCKTNHNTNIDILLSDAGPEMEQGVEGATIPT